MRINDTFQVKDVLVGCTDIPCSSLSCLDCPFQDDDEISVHSVLAEWQKLKAQDAKARRIVQTILTEKPSSREELEKIMNDFMDGTDDDC